MGWRQGRKGGFGQCQQPSPALSQLPLGSQRPRRTQAASALTPASPAPQPPRRKGRKRALGLSPTNTPLGECSTNRQRSCITCGSRNRILKKMRKGSWNQNHGGAPETPLTGTSFQCKRLIREGKVKRALWTPLLLTLPPRRHSLCERATLPSWWDAPSLSPLLSSFSPVLPQASSSRLASCAPSSCHSHLPVTNLAVPRAPHLCVQLPPHHLCYTYPQWPGILVPSLDFSTLFFISLIGNPVFPFVRPNPFTPSLLSPTSSAFKVYLYPNFSQPSP